VNLVVGNCAEIMQVRRGSMGKAIPGHRVEVIDDEGNVVPPGTVGEVAILRPDPVMFLEYWRNPEATKDKFIKDWSCTGIWPKKMKTGTSGSWPQGRPHYQLGLSYRPGGDRRLPAETSRRYHGRGHRRAGPGPGEIVKAFIVLKPKSPRVPLCRRKSPTS